MSLKIKFSDLLPDHIRMNFIDPLKTLLTVMLKYCLSVKVIENSALNVCNAQDSGKSSKLDTRRGNNYNLSRRHTNFGNKKTFTSSWSYAYIILCQNEFLSTLYMPTHDLEERISIEDNLHKFEVWVWLGRYFLDFFLM